jgi:hypothetical protein
MTTQTEPFRLKDMGDVRTAAPVEGKYGPQWELVVQWSFSNYTSRAWIDRDPSVTAIAPGKYWCIIERRKLNAKQDGTIHDGSQHWMYQWQIVGFDVGDDADPPVNVPSVAPITPINAGQASVNVASIPKTSDTTNRDDHPNKRASIERQSWNNNRIQIMGHAKDIMVAEMNFTPDAIGDSTWEERLMHWYHILGETVFPDPDSDAPEDPESNEVPSEGTSVPEGETAELPWGTI